MLLSAGAIFMFLKEKLKEKWVITAFCVLVLFDLIGVDKRYVNNDDFVSPIHTNTFFNPLLFNSSGITEIEPAP
mgnify:CR=1 FL=1